MASDIAREIASDPRFSHILTDPRFKTIPRRSRKVHIGSRFRSMFTDDKFKVTYGVDKRGRRVQQTSAEDLQRYYDLQDDAAVTLSEGESDSDGESDTSTDTEEVTALREPEVIHAWWDDEVSPSHSVETGSRLALCRMDWDRVNATDILVFLSSFKPQGGSVLSVTLFPSDFGLERMKSEDTAGPAELFDQSDSAMLADMSQEGRGYSNERLRQYQLQRLNYYYAVVECDSTATAEHVYAECDGIEYEHCGGKLDLRFIPDGMTFDDRDPKSVATETTIPAGYSPPEFVTSALQQSKVHLTWDETDPQRLQTTMRKFSRDDMLKMDFDAYLASSGGESGSESGTSVEGGEVPKADHSAAKHSDMVTKYRSLLADSGDGCEGGDKSEGGKSEEVMEISWEPGLREGVEEMVKRRRVEGEGEGGTTWDHYLRERSKRTREKRAEGKGEVVHGNHGDEKSRDNDVGFDDPFFKDDVAVTTTGKKNDRKRKRKDGEKEKQDKSQLELLMMEGGEEEEGGRAHFSLDSIMQQERQAGKKTRRKKRKENQLSPKVDPFEVNVRDDRFSALYSNHLYAPDPAHPHYRATKAMEALMKERRKRRERGGAIEAEATPTSDQDQARQFSDPSVSQLVKAVRSKTQSLKERKKRKKLKKTSANI